MYVFLYKTAQFLNAWHLQNCDLDRMSTLKMIKIIIDFTT